MGGIRDKTAMRWRIKTKSGERERKGRIGFRMRGSAVQPVGAAALDRPSCDGECFLHLTHKRVIHGGDAERGRSGGIQHAKEGGSYMRHEERRALPHQRSHFISSS